MPDPDTTPEILTALQTLGAEGQIIEIRILGDDGVASGYFDSYEMAAREIRIRDRDSRVSGIYLTLNEVNPSLLSRRANRIKTRLGKSDATTGDADIIRRRWLPIDIDPCRPSVRYLLIRGRTCRCPLPGRYHQGISCKPWLA